MTALCSGWDYKAEGLRSVIKTRKHNNTTKTTTRNKAVVLFVPPVLSSSAPSHYPSLYTITSTVRLLRGWLSWNHMHTEVSQSAVSHRLHHYCHRSSTEVNTEFGFEHSKDRKRKSLLLWKIHNFKQFHCLSCCNPFLSWHECKSAAQSPLYNVSGLPFYKPQTDISISRGISLDILKTSDDIHSRLCGVRTRCLLQFSLVLVLKPWVSQRAHECCS